MPNYHVAQMFFCAMFGAFILYLTNQLNGKQPFSLFKGLQIKMDNRPGMIISDMVASSAIGALLVSLAWRPETIGEAVSAGLGFTGFFTAFIKTGENP
jgi:hypothetical protein